MELEQIYTVSDAAAVINQTLEYAYPVMIVVGEVAEYKVSGGKWIFFNIKDDEMSLKCFAPAWQINVPIEDGMQVQILARPRLGKYGFSLNVEAVKPVGEGSIKRAFEILRQKLEADGLFATERKRSLPILPEHIGVISSTAAAGYQDFIKILNHRFGGINIEVADVAVQGDGAAEQIVQALKFFNESSNPPEVIAILRGGGSRDDLVAFDDETLVRVIAASRVPTIVGVGHEVDITLADLAADVRASTPSNAAEILVPDRREIISSVNAGLKNAINQYATHLEDTEKFVTDSVECALSKLENLSNSLENSLKHLVVTLRQLDPKAALRRGYSIVRNKNNQVLKTKPTVGDELNIENAQTCFSAIVTKV